ncbi:MAG: T9SS type A sorting domain-containing protein, partial [Bacteroidota bacterium]
VFPEVGNFNDLSGDNFVEFVGIKVGDLDNSAGVFQGIPPEENDNLWEAPANGTTDLEVRPVSGRDRTWDIFLAAGRERYGLQFSLDLPAKTRMEPGLISAAEYRLAANARLHVSYAPDQLTPLATDRALLRFTTQNAADKPVLVSQDDGRYFLRPEAYDGELRTFSLRLEAAGAEVSTGIFPNPVVDAATLRVDWPVAEHVILGVHDVSGRLLGERKLALGVGENLVPVRAGELGSGAGVYLLRVRGEDEEVSLRVIRR